MRVAVLAGLALGGCTEPSIELGLAPSTDVLTKLDTSCVRSVLVQLDGINIDANPDDNLQTCYELPDSAPHSTWTELQASLAGKFSSPLPASGLSAVEVYGYNGACTQDSVAKRKESDLVFYGFGRNSDDESVRIDVTGNLDCGRETVTARAIDINKLDGPNKCAGATFTRADGISLSTFFPRLTGRGVDWWGAASAEVDATSQLAMIDAATEVLGRSCLVASYTDTTLTRLSTSCITPIPQNVCDDSIREVPSIDPQLWGRAQDAPKFGVYGGLVVGVVYNNSVGPRANVKVSIVGDEDDQELGRVVYLTRGIDDQGATIIKGLPDDTAATDATGLFGVYTTSLLRVKFELDGQSVERNVGTLGNTAAGDAHSAAMIVKL